MLWPINQDDHSLLYGAFFFVVSCYYWYRYLYTTEQKAAPYVTSPTCERAKRLNKALASALSSNIILPEKVTSFLNAADLYSDQEESERVPSYIVQPKSVESASTTVKVLKHAYDEFVLEHRKDDLESGIRDAGLFAVRGGGHSSVSGAASIDGRDILRLLDENNLAVMGDRKSHVGVGGLLTRGISLFSPQYDFAENNVISYDVVIVDGSVLTASKISHPSLWCALKGGPSNLGIVTRFTLRTPLPSQARLAPVERLANSKPSPASPTKWKRSPRWTYGTTTITRYAATLTTAHVTYKDDMQAVRGVKGAL
ncbi:hypothetical protein PMIN03_006321 [Paraphaeosphaeria minitans]